MKDVAPIVDTSEDLLVRQMSSFANFGISFSIISVPTGVSIMFAYGINTGGPSVILATRFVVPFFTTFVALSLAEICSTYPTAGGVYHWSFQLAPDGQRAWWAWITAWFNILGMLAGSASIDFGLAINFMALLNLCSGTEINPFKIFGIYVLLLGLHCMINFMPTSYISYFNNASVWVHIITLVVIFSSVLALSPSRSISEWSFVNNTGSSNTYCVFISSLFSAFIFTGYDASATMAEETHDPHMNAPWGIITAVLVSYLACVVFVVGLLVSIPSLDNLIASPSPFAQLLLDTTTKSAAAVFLALILSCNFCCGLGSVTSTSRVVFAFARDGGLPFSRYLVLVTKEGVPYVSVLVVVFTALVSALPYLMQPVAFYALTSLSVLGVSISYAIPIALRLLRGGKFTRSAFHLGNYSQLCGVVACSWVALMCVMFLLPTIFPVTGLTMNYACVVVGLVWAGAYVGWIYGAKKTFQGPPLGARGSVEVAIIASSAFSLHHPLLLD